MRHQHRLGNLGVGLLGAGEGFDDRRKIGAGIGEEKINAVVGQGTQISLGGNRGTLSRLWCSHAVSPLRSYSFFEGGFTRQGEDAQT